MCLRLNLHEKIQLNCFSKQYKTYYQTRINFQNCIKAVAATATMSYEDGKKFEKEMFETLDYNQGAALIYAFFAERKVAAVMIFSNHNIINPPGFHVNY